MNVLIGEESTQRVKHASQLIGFRPHLPIFFEVILYVFVNFEFYSL